MQVGCAFEHQLAPAADDVTASWVVSCDTLSNVESVRCPEESQIGESVSQTADCWSVVVVYMALDYSI